MRLTETKEINVNRNTVLQEFYNFIDFLCNKYIFLNLFPVLLAMLLTND